MVMEVVSISYHGKEVGAVSYDTERAIGAFEFSQEFKKSGIELSPLKMPLQEKSRSRIYTFAGLDRDTYKGMPGMIADSLPDDFGNAVLNAWVASRGLSTASITPLQRLQYTGTRGMGALEYRPATNVKHLSAAQEIDVKSLVGVAQDILDQRADFALDVHPGAEYDQQAMLALMSVGMSAGGARPKAVLAFNNDFSQVRSGQADVPEGFTHYLMKFDGVSEHAKNKETFGDPMGYGAMEYAYHLMAKLCGVNMMPCHLLDEGNRRHFITQRFDRIGNHKVHVQTLNGLAHVSFKQVGSYSYEELLGVARELRLDAQAALQLFKRMVFNVVARNHDDHSKNFAFLLDRDDKWQLAPAYDIAYSYKPGSPWVNSHWMKLNGKRDEFSREDFYAFEKLATIFSRKKIDLIIDETIEHVSTWHTIAADVGVPKSLTDVIQTHLRLKI